MILALRAHGLGGVLTAVPALRALRHEYPDDRLVLAAAGALAPVVALVDAVDELLPVSGLGGIPPLAETPELAVNLHGHGPGSIADLIATRPKHLLTHRHPAHPQVIGPEWIDGIHEVHRWCALLDSAGIRSDPRDVYLAPPETESPWSDSVVLHPGASRPARRWPLGRFAEVAAHVRRSGRRVVIAGSAGDRPNALAIAYATGIPAADVVAGELDLGATTSLVASAELVVSGDTGIGHLATALHTPSVLLFGPASPRWVGPPPDVSVRHVALWAGRDGDRAAEPDLLDITTRDVCAAVDDQLQDGDLLDVS